jgi:iron complex outermembrane receptor protein
MLIGQYQSNFGHFEWLLAPAQIRDMGRVANDTRTTFGPEENHYPLRVAYQHNNWESALSFYDMETATDILNPDSSHQITTKEAKNNNWNVHKRWPITAGEYRVGYEYSVRNGVKAEEIEQTINGSEMARPALPDGREDQHAIFAASAWAAAKWSLHAGMRFTQLNQQASGYGDEKDRALSLSSGVRYQLDPAWALSLALSNGVRFPALTERYYNGLTPRGITVGNPDLKAETARAVELSAQWQSNTMKIELHAFTQHIDNYIERIRLTPPTPRRFSYDNLTAGKINGVELNHAWQLSEVLSVNTRGHHIRGESDSGAPLSGMPSDTVSVGLAWQFNDCQYALDGNWRKRHDDSGSDELALAARHYFDLHAACQWDQRWHFGATVNNAQDDQWLLNADTTSGFSRGRNLSITVSFTP